VKAILTYHSVDDSGSVISIDPRTFRRHVEWLASGRVRVVPLDELPARPDTEDAVALTFDDGFANVGEIAVPLLRDHGMPATLFIVTDAVGADNRWQGRADAGIPVMPLLGWDALGRLAQQGIALGAHGCTHADLCSLDAAATEQEIVASRARLVAELGIDAGTFAYAYGHVTDAAHAVVAREFRYGCTTRLATLRPEDDAALLPRLDSYYLRAPGALEAWGTARFRWRVGLLAGARSVRGTLTRSLAR
jgi:peptidoglycan/xylan/chitin deacetylase (PgdA/CDA1 family)